MNRFVVSCSFKFESAVEAKTFYCEMVFVVPRCRVALRFGSHQLHTWRYVVFPGVEHGLRCSGERWRIDLGRSELNTRRREDVSPNEWADAVMTFERLCGWQMAERCARRLYGLRFNPFKPEHQVTEWDDLGGRG